jgi:hypothetical protein
LLSNKYRAHPANPEDPNMNALLTDAGKLVADALAKLGMAANGIMPSQVEDFQRKAGEDIEELASKELQGAADVIDKCVAKLNAAMEAARERMTAKGVDIDEQNITEAILESCQAIAKATGVLIQSASQVQTEYQKLAKAPATTSVYRRDPQWAQGLISAARTVSGAVTHLVKAANSAAQGNASEELLVVAAQSVSAATTQLVTASTVKTGNANSGSQSRLNDAAKKVTAATQSLVQAARRAAQFEEENQQSGGSDGNYTMAESKIREMEQQMAILRLEKELNRAREGLMKMRKDEYQVDVNPDFKPSAPAKTAAPAKPAPIVPTKSASPAPNVNRAQPSVPVKAAAPAPKPAPVASNGTGNSSPVVKPLTFGGPARGLPTPASGGNPPGRPSRPGSVVPPGEQQPATGGVNWKNTNNTYKR